MAPIIRCDNISKCFRVAGQGPRGKHNYRALREELARWAKIARKCDQIVSFAEVEQFLDTPVKRYSSGMYVRLAFAVAAHLQPEILIVDEVLAVGDLGFQRKCMGRMREVGRSGCTVLFVSHSMPAIDS